MASGIYTTLTDVTKILPGARSRTAGKDARAVFFVEFRAAARGIFSISVPPRFAPPPASAWMHLATASWRTPRPHQKKYHYNTAD
jgi:hypothetical protein